MQAFWIYLKIEVTQSSGIHLGHSVLHTLDVLSPSGTSVVVYVEAQLIKVKFMIWLKKYIHIQYL